MNYKKDFLASIVVFLVALPLCMGIAIASGVPVAYGVLSGIIGGLVVGFLTGSPLQVSGPAAGLIVIVYDIVQSHGLKGLGIVTFIAGAIQFIMALFKLGPYFRAISPAVINGMLSGIGVIILASQFHVMFDATPASGPIENILKMPETLSSALLKPVALISLFSLLLIVGWNHFKLKYKWITPGALIGIIGATLAVYFSQVEVNKVSIEGNFLESIKGYLLINNLGELSWELFLLAIPLALVATTETLLCTNAIEKMAPHAPVNYNKELYAQGVGNMLCGFFAALPMTGVIVRSAANVEANAETQASSILHGLWLLLMVTFFGNLLGLVPTAALATILLLTGIKLVNWAGLKKTFYADRLDFGIWVVTMASIVGINLLAGIGIGFFLSLLKLLYSIHPIEIKALPSEDLNESNIQISGKASFLALPEISKKIEQNISGKSHIKIHTNHLIYQDAAFIEYIENLKLTQSHKGIEVSIVKSIKMHKEERIIDGVDAH